MRTVYSLGLTINSKLSIRLEPCHGLHPKHQRENAGTGYQYQKLRKALLPSAYGTPCVRCGLPMLPGQKLHLDHDDYDRSILRGFAHSWCNIRAAAKKARVIQLAAKRTANRPVHRW
jgi:hypothetical protein